MPPTREIIEAVETAYAEQPEIAAPALARKVGVTLPQLWEALESLAPTKEERNGNGTGAAA